MERWNGFVVVAPDIIDGLVLECGDGGVEDIAICGWRLFKFTNFEGWFDKWSTKNGLIIAISLDGLFGLWSLWINDVIWSRKGGNVGEVIL